MDYAWGANGLDAIITQVKLGFTTVSILLCSAAGAAAPVLLQGMRGWGTEMGRGPQCGILVPWLRNEWILCAAELTSLFCLPGWLFFQLLNQFENTGPPPADKEKIQALPTIQITQEHVGRCLLHGIVHRVLTGTVCNVFLGLEFCLFVPLRHKTFQSGQRAEGALLHSRKKRAV